GPGLITHGRDIVEADAIGAFERGSRDRPRDIPKLGFDAAFGLADDQRAIAHTDVFECNAAGKRSVAAAPRETCPVSAAVAIEHEIEDRTRKLDAARFDGTAEQR